MPAWSYVLLLEDSCYYCGQTENYTSRIRQHFEHDGGSRWCNLHNPIEVVFMQKYDTVKEAFAKEKQNTIDYMRIHGIRKVRGANALNCKSDCYKPNNLWWVPSELRADAEAGLLGELDTSG